MEDEGGRQHADGARVGPAQISPLLTPNTRSSSPAVIVTAPREVEAPLALAVGLGEEREGPSRQARFRPAR